MERGRENSSFPVLESSPPEADVENRGFSKRRSEATSSKSPTAPTMNEVSCGGEQATFFACVRI